MNKVDVDQHLFHMTLQAIADGAEVSHNKDTLFVGETNGTALSLDQMQHVLGFIRSNASFLESSDKDSLIKLHDRLSPEVNEEVKKEIDALFQKLEQYNPIEVELPPYSSPLFSPCSSLDIRQSTILLSSQLEKALENPMLFVTSNLDVVFEAPKNWDPAVVLNSLKHARETHGSQNKQLTEILDQLIARYENPNYVLQANLLRALQNPSLTITSDLSVVSGKPKNWNQEEVRLALEKFRATHEPEQLELLEILDKLIEEHTPPNLVKLGLCIAEKETEDSSGAVNMGLKNFLSSGMACLSTKALVSTRNTNEYSDVEIYSMKDGGLLLWVPEGVKVEDLGIDLTEFEKLPKGSKIAMEAFNPTQDLKRALAQPKNAPEVHRLIVALGHGSPETMVEARIAGLPAHVFQDVLGVLTENGLAFLTLISCFSGGENVTKINIPSGIVPCPMLVWNATESVAMGTPDSFKIVAKQHQTMGSQLFSPLASGRTPRQPHPVSQNTIREIGMQAFNLNLKSVEEALQLQNLQTILLPSNKADIPKVAYTGARPEKIFDLDDAIRRQQHQKILSIGTKAKIPVDASQKTTLFCSAPYIPASIIVTGSNKEFGITSRGGDSIHFIDELSIPDQTLDQFVLASANKVMRISFGTPARLLGANKYFYFSKLICKDKFGKPQIYHDVQIVLTRSKSEVLFTDESGQHYRREIIIDMDQFMRFSFPKSAKGIKPEVKIDKDDVIFNCFNHFLRCTPSEKHLLATTAGQISFSSLCDDFEIRLKERLPTTYIELYRCAIDPLSVNKLMDKISSLKSEEQKAVVDRALQLAIAADNKAAVLFLLDKFGPVDREIVDGKNALHIAAEKGSRSIVQELLKVIKDPDKGDGVGRTPLHYAVIENNHEIVELLLPYCKDTVQDMIEKTPLEFAILSKREELANKLLFGTNEPITQTSLLTLLAALSAEDLVFLKRLMEGGRINDWQQFLELMLKNSADLISIDTIKQIIEKMKPIQEKVDEHGHHLLMRLLFANKLLSFEQADVLVKYFPLSEQNKLSLSKKWLEWQKNNLTSTSKIQMMKAWNIPFEPFAEWQEVFMQSVLKDLKPKECSVYIDAGLTLDWTRLGDAIFPKVKKGNEDSYDWVSSFDMLVNHFHPDLSKDSNWSEICGICITNQNMPSIINALLECGAKPFPPEVTKEMTGEELYQWVMKNPRHIPEFATTLASGKDLDFSTPAAKTVLALLLARKNVTRAFPVKLAVLLLLDKGVVYDPTHADVTETEWNSYKNNPTNAWIAASKLMPDLKEKIAKEVNAAISDGSLTNNDIRKIMDSEIPFDFKLIPEEALAKECEEKGTPEFLSKLDSLGLVTDSFAAKVFELMLNSESTIKPLLFHAIFQYNIPNKESLISSAKDKLIQESLNQPKFIEGHFITNLTAFIEHGAKLECNESLLQLIEKVKSPKLLQLVKEQFGQLSVEEVHNILKSASNTEILKLLIQAGIIDPNDSGFAKLKLYELQQLELARYEKGVKPSEEECLRRYWSDKLIDPLREVIGRDYKPDPASIQAMDALKEALKNKEFHEAKELFKKGVSVPISEDLIEYTRELFKGYSSEEELKFINQMIEKGLDPRQLKDVIQDYVAKEMKEGNFGYVCERYEIIKHVLPIKFETPSQSVEKVILKATGSKYLTIYGKDLQILASMGYPVEVHRDSLVKMLSKKDFASYDRGQSECEILTACPSLVKSDVLPTWLNRPVPLALLRRVEELGGDPEFVREWVQKQWPAIFDNNRGIEEFDFLVRMVPVDQWKQPEAIKLFKKILLGYDEILKIPLISYLTRLDLFSSISTPELYSNTKGIDFIKILADNKVPISNDDRKKVIELLIKYDELALVKQLQSL